MPEHLRYAWRHIEFQVEGSGASARLQVSTVHEGEVARYYGFNGGDVIAAINGDPPGDPAAIDRLLHGFPQSAPDSIWVRRKSKVTEIRYVSPSLLAEASRIMIDAGVFDQPSEETSRFWNLQPDWPRLRVQKFGQQQELNRVRIWDPNGRDAARLGAVAKRIEDLARNSRHDPGGSGQADCKTIDQAVTNVEVALVDKVLELVYIDWLQPGFPAKMAPSPLPVKIPRDTGENCEKAQPAAMVKMPQGFSIDRTEVTRCQYAAWLASHPSGELQVPGCRGRQNYTPSCEWPPGAKGDHPVVCVAWCGAYAYCKSVGKRLCGAIGGGPSDYKNYGDLTSQWYAAARGYAGAYPYGDVREPQTCNSRDNPLTGCARGACTTVEVGSLPECRRADLAEGIFDLSGNVAEFLDACEEHRCRTAGDSFRSVAYGGDEPGSPSDFVGFRCCSDP